MRPFVSMAICLSFLLLSLFLNARNVVVGQEAFSPQRILGQDGSMPGESAVRLERSDPSEAFQLVDNTHLGTVTLHADRAPLTEVLTMIARRHNLNLVAASSVNGEITLSLENAHLNEVLDAITGVSGHRWHRAGNLLYVTGVSGENRLDAGVQGRILRIFPLNFISATDAQPVASGLLSPIGQAFITSSDSADKTKTTELLVVEDIPAALQRVEAYLLQVDQAPRQVLIEVHVLQVVLNNGLKHGVNLRPMARLGGGSVTLQTVGLADENAALGMKMLINGSDVSGLVELIQTQTNARTLASPKLIVANRQESNIQIGKRLSYLTTTTTQTASVQSVQFLDTGVVVVVTPIISDDNQVLLSIAPKVSGGQLNTETDLPEEESTELSTTVLLPDGGGVIMGGLLKDEDIESISEVPGFCRIPYLGHLFRRKEVTHIRTEIVIALVAHIVPTVESIRNHELCELQQVLPPYAAQSLQRPYQGQGIPVMTGVEYSPDPQSYSPMYFQPSATAIPPVTVKQTSVRRVPAVNP